MIYDSLKHISAYRGLSANMDRAIDLLCNTDFSTLAAGRYDVDGDQLFYLVQEPALLEEDEARYELHRRYADIQLALTSGETILALPAVQIEAWQPFDEEKDVAFSVNAEPGIPLEMRPGCFAIFFPQDAHMTCLRGGDETSCRKVIVKVKL